MRKETIVERMVQQSLSWQENKGVFFFVSGYNNT